MRLRWQWFAVPSLAFALLCLPFVPLLGFQDDEALFAPAVYPERCGPAFAPNMLMSYVGATKAWLYRGVFTFTPPSLWSVRLLPLALSACAVGLTVLTLRRVNPLAAVVAGALLATDPTLVLTSTFDWGPVALQQALFALAVFAYYERWLAVAGLACGLALWNKALAAWMLAPLLLMAVAQRDSPLRRARQALRFLAAAALGAAPLIYFNVRDPWRTFTENARLELVHLAWKATVLHDTLAARGYADYFFYPAPNAAAEPGTWLPLLALAAVAAALILRQYDALRVMAVAVLAWLAMVMNGGGGSIHHTVLLWPAPQVGIALSLRQVGLVAALLAGGQNLRVLHSYYEQALVRGGNKGWTDAALALPAALAPHAPSRVYASDWGIKHSLCLLDPGRVDSPDPADPNLFGDRQAIFVRSVEHFVFNGGTYTAISEAARQRGLKPETLATVSDSHGRAAFELVRFR
jgi:Dolichyl-phosphate-mannose-protein mannosyltransferase